MAMIKKGARLHGPARDAAADEVRKLYDKGNSIRTISQATGRSYGNVHRLLTESGASLRPRGGSNRKG